MDARGGRTGLGSSPLALGCWLEVVDEEECFLECAPEGGDRERFGLSLCADTGFMEKDCSKGLGSDSKFERIGGRLG